MHSYTGRKGLSMAEFDRDFLNGKDDFNVGRVNYTRIVYGRDKFGLSIFENNVKNKDNKRIS